MTVDSERTFRGASVHAKRLNLALAFVLELALLCAFGAWALGLGIATGFRWVLATFLVATTMLVWARWCAPRAAKRLSDGRLLLSKLVLFILGSAAFAAAGLVTMATSFLIVAILNLALARAWDQV